MVIAISDDSMALFFEFFQIVDDDAAEEGRTVFEGRFINDDRGAFAFDSLHDALDAALAEVV